MRNDYFIKFLLLITKNKVINSMFISNICLILTPGLRQKTTIYMIKIFYLQVNPVCNLGTIWCCILSYIIFGSSTIVQFV